MAGDEAGLVRHRSAVVSLPDRTASLRRTFCVNVLASYQDLIRVDRELCTVDLVEIAEHGAPISIGVSRATV